jgi:hypothetical protein
MNAYAGKLNTLEELTVYVIFCKTREVRSPDSAMYGRKSFGTTWLGCKDIGKVFVGVPLALALWQTLSEKPYRDQGYTAYLAVIRVLGESANTVFFDR